MHPIYWFCVLVVVNSGNRSLIRIKYVYFRDLLLQTRSQLYIPVKRLLFCAASHKIQGHILHDYIGVQCIIVGVIPATRVPEKNACQKAGTRLCIDLGRDVAAICHMSDISYNHIMFTSILHMNTNTIW